MSILSKIKSLFSSKAVAEVAEEVKQAVPSVDLESLSKKELVRYFNSKGIRVDRRCGKQTNKKRYTKLL